MNTPNGAIAVFLDGTDFAEQALPLSVSIARRTGQPLQLVQVFGPHQSVCAYEIDHAQRYLHGLTIWAHRQGVDCEPAILEGETVEALVHFTESSGARYLSIAANGPLSNEDCFSDQVSHRLLRLLPVPVLAQTPATLALRPDVADAAGPIIVPMDGSPLAELALADAAYLARALRLEINIVHAEIPPPAGELYSLALEAPIASLRDSAAYMESVAQRLRAEGVTVRVGTGLARPVDFVRNCVQMQDATMVVMSTRGQSGLCHPFLGQVANAVVREVDVPLLLIGPTALGRRRESSESWRAHRHVAAH